ncbi:hypothetical protein L226DRAFT_357034 [Lentinus tigrinus ALCF2SS1-7]|uniref:uncharacterized protein n=1 Tax=Lentinus tigrinus ALCF2SS1-7 TaxID=1328758 RepID=UPI0011661A11|nr:hypothetical protein L226DRAFT_357034 [Lentinus tigrinus ALCF2SS1-7]
MPVDSSRSDAQTDFVVRSLSAIAFALLYYDYALTFGAEVGRFWRFRKGRPSWGTIGFFLNRYLSILGHIPVIWEFFGSEAYSVFALPGVSSDAGGRFIVALQISRVYALYNGSRKVLCSLICLSIVVFAISGVSPVYLMRTGT